MSHKSILEKKDSFNRLKKHLDLMKKELDNTNNQIKSLEKNKKISEWQKIDFANGKSINDL